MEISPETKALLINHLTKVFCRKAFEVLCFYSTAATPVFHSAILSFLSPHVASTEKLRGKKQRESIRHDIAVPPFPAAGHLTLAESRDLFLPPFPSVAPLPPRLREPPWRLELII